jgi:pimeloyl-ACP methyl ester carboxylesterase
MRANEFLPKGQYLGGAFGFIGVVPTLFQNPSHYKTGIPSGIPQATDAQKAVLRKIPALFIWGDKDTIFPENINRHTYYSLIEAYGDSGALTVQEVKGMGHATTNACWKTFAPW